MRRFGSSNYAASSTAAGMEVVAVVVVCPQVSQLEALLGPATVGMERHLEAVIGLDELPWQNRHR